MKVELSDEQFGELYDSLIPESTPPDERECLLWESLADDERRIARVLYDRARNVGFDEGEAHAKLERRQHLRGILESLGTAQTAPESKLRWAIEKLQELLAWQDGELAELRDDLGALPWRTGSRNRQTVYDAHDRQVASAQTGELAQRIVDAVNAPSRWYKEAARLGDLLLRTIIALRGEADGTLQVEGVPDAVAELRAQLTEKEAEAKQASEGPEDPCKRMETAIHRALNQFAWGKPQEARGILEETIDIVRRHREQALLARPAPSAVAEPAPASKGEGDGVDRVAGVTFSEFPDPVTGEPRWKRQREKGEGDG